MDYNADNRIRSFTQTIGSHISVSSGRYIPQNDTSSLVSFADFLVQQNSNFSLSTVNQTIMPTEAIRQLANLTNQQRINAGMDTLAVNIPELTPLETLIAEINSCAMLVISIPSLNYSCLVSDINVESLYDNHFVIRGHITNKLVVVNQSIVIFAQLSNNMALSKITALNTSNSISFIAYTVASNNLDSEKHMIEVTIELL